MNSRNVLIILTALIFMGTACTPQSNQEVTADLSTKTDSVSYALGQQYGGFLAQQGFEDVDINNLIAGFQTSLNDGETLLSAEEAQALVQSYAQELAQIKSEEAMEEGTNFLAENLSNEDVMETESGLQYKILEEGTGDSPSAEDTVRVHYEGKTLDGNIFDSSYQRNQPAEFPLNRVIAGWTEGVQLMKEGATYEFYIPAELAYGTRPPQGSGIAPNSVLIFKVELLEVKSN